MTTKLKNVQAVRQMLDGTHKTQTRKLVSFATPLPKVERAVGERWTDDEGNEWEQAQGYKIKHGRYGSVMDEIRDSLFRHGKNCPECAQPMLKRMDRKFYHIHGKCMDCVVKEETRMRIEGRYDEYEREKVRRNVLAFLAEAEKEVEVVKRAMTGKVTYVNQDGKTEEWESPYTPEYFDNQFAKFKEEMLAKVGGPDGQLGQA